MSEMRLCTTILMDRRPTNVRIKEKNAPVRFPDLVMCVEQESGLVLGIELLDAEGGDEAVIRVARRILEAAQQGAPAMKVLWVVRQEQVGEVMAGAFGSENVLLVTGVDFALWDEAYAALDGEMGGGGALLPHLWRGDISDQEVAEFHEAAALFYQAKPWRFWDDDDLLEISPPGACPGPLPLLVSITGGAGIMRGLVIFESQAQFDRLLLDQGEPSGTFIGFEPLRKVPHLMVVEAEQQGWKVVNKSAFPTVMKVKDGQPEPCRGDDLRRTTVALRAASQALTDIRQEMKKSRRQAAPKQPAKKPAGPGPVIYQLKVSLKYITPQIWRRIQAPADITLAELHYVLQAAMGWENCHLHEFRIGGTRYAPWNLEGDPIVDEAADEETAILRTIAPRVKSGFFYTYDFGDGWVHNLVVEKIIPAEEGKQYPVCISGKRACPLEDCGGPHGYALILRALANPTHPDSKDWLEWIGGHWEAEAFDLEEINRRLAEMG